MSKSWSRSLLKKALGEPQDTPLEERVLNLVCALACLAMLALAVVNSWVGNPAREIWMSFAGMGIAGGTYAASRLYGQGQRLREPLYLLFWLMGVSTWLTNQGSEGGTPALFIILILGGVVILPRRRRLYYVSATVFSVLALLVVEWQRPEWIESYLSASHRQWDVSLVLMLSLLMAASLMYLLHSEYQRERDRSTQFVDRVREDNEKLQKALAEIRALEGLLPICSGCKSIRDRQGEWQKLETYLLEYSEVELTHGICPSCHASLYPEAYAESQGANTDS